MYPHQIKMRAEHPTLDEHELRIKRLEKLIPVVGMYQKLSKSMENIGLTKADAARVLGVTRKTVKRMVDDGRLLEMKNGRVDFQSVLGSLAGK